MSQAVREREEAHVPTKQFGAYRRLHVDDDCDRLRGETRPVDPADFPDCEWCQYCTGEWSEGASVGGYVRLLADEDVTDLDDVAAALEGSE